MKCLSIQCNIVIRKAIWMHQCMCVVLSLLISRVCGKFIIAFNFTMNCCQALLYLVLQISGPLICRCCICNVVIVIIVVTVVVVVFVVVVVVMIVVAIIIFDID
jgi:hypothetical protein